MKTFMIGLLLAFVFLNCKAEGKYFHIISNLLWYIKRIRKLMRVFILYLPNIYIVL